MNKPLQQNVPDLGNIESRQGARAAIKVLHSYLRQYVKNMDTFQSDVVNSVNPLIWAAPIASAATLTPINTLQPVTGAVPVQTINANIQSQRFVLLAVDGFSLITGGNIGAAATIPAGTAINIYLERGTNMWYPG